MLVRRLPVPVQRQSRPIQKRAVAEVVASGAVAAVLSLA